MKKVLNALFNVIKFLLNHSPALLLIVVGNAAVYYTVTRNDDNQLILNQFGYQTKIVSGQCFARIDQNWFKCEHVLNSAKGFKNLNQD